MIHLVPLICLMVVSTPITRSVVIPPDRTITYGYVVSHPSPDPFLNTSYVLSTYPNTLLYGVGAWFDQHEQYKGLLLNKGKQRVLFTPLWMNVGPTEASTTFKLNRARMFIRNITSGTFGWVRSISLIASVSGMIQLFEQMNTPLINKTMMVQTLLPITSPVHDMSVSVLSPNKWITSDTFKLVAGRGYKTYGLFVANDTAFWPDARVRAIIENKLVESYFEVYSRSSLIKDETIREIALRMKEANPDVMMIIGRGADAEIYGRLVAAWREINWRPQTSFPGGVMAELMGGKLLPKPEHVQIPLEPLLVLPSNMQGFMGAVQWDYRLDGDFYRAPPSVNERFAYDDQLGLSSPRVLGNTILNYTNVQLSKTLKVEDLLAAWFGVLGNFVYEYALRTLDMDIDLVTPALLMDTVLTNAPTTATGLLRFTKATHTIELNSWMVTQVQADLSVLPIVPINSEATFQSSPSWSQLIDVIRTTYDGSIVVLAVATTLLSTGSGFLMWDMLTMSAFAEWRTKPYPVYNPKTIGWMLAVMVSFSVATWAALSIGQTSVLFLAMTDGHEAITYLPAPMLSHILIGCGAWLICIYILLAGVVELRSTPDDDDEDEDTGRLGGEFDRISQPTGSTTTTRATNGSHVTQISKSADHTSTAHHHGENIGQRCCRRYHGLGGCFIAGGILIISIGLQFGLVVSSTKGYITTNIDVLTCVWISVLCYGVLVPGLYGLAHFRASWKRYIVFGLLMVLVPLLFVFLGFSFASHYTRADDNTVSESDGWARSTYQIAAAGLSVVCFTVCLSVGMYASRSMSGVMVTMYRTWRGKQREKVSVLNHKITGLSLSLRDAELVRDALAVMQPLILGDHPLLTKPVRSEEEILRGEPSKGSLVVSLSKPIKSGGGGGGDAPPLVIPPPQQQYEVAKPGGRVEIGLTRVHEPSSSPVRTNDNTTDRKSVPPLLAIKQGSHMYTNSSIDTGNNSAQTNATVARMNELASYPAPTCLAVLSNPVTRQFLLYRADKVPINTFENVTCWAHIDHYGTLKDEAARDKWGRYIVTNFLLDDAAYKINVSDNQPQVETVLNQTIRSSTPSWTQDLFVFLKYPLQSLISGNEYAKLSETFRQFIKLWHYRDVPTLLPPSSLPPLSTLLPGTIGHRSVPSSDLAIPDVPTMPSRGSVRAKMS